MRRIIFFVLLLLPFALLPFITPVKWDPKAEYCTYHPEACADDQQDELQQE